MTKGKLFTIVILSIAVIVLSTYVAMNVLMRSEDAKHMPSSGDGTTRPTTQDAAAISSAEEASRAAAEAERLEAERRAAEEASRLEARNREIAERTFIVAAGASLLETPDASAIVAGEVTERRAYYVEDIVKNEAGEVLYYQVRENIDATETAGYVQAKYVRKSRADFIAKPIEDVDYHPFERHPDFPNNPRIKAKAVFVTISTASGARFDELLDLIDSTELNAMVIDVKDDNDFMLFRSVTADRLNPKSNDKVGNRDVESIIRRAKERGVYLIARIVTFKSPIYARNHPDRAITRSGGQAYADGDGLLWASPHDRTLWEYNVGVAKEAAALGFNEIQFDYVRFPAVSSKIQVDYRNTNGESRTAAIQGFLKYAYEQLADSQVYIAADVFGWTATAIDDVGIGQHWEAMSNVVDYMCPMVYPSHYSAGNFGLAVPDAKPYETIRASVGDAVARNANIDTPGLLRPWIQDFTAPWVQGHINYGGKELRAQIQALEDMGIEEWLIWNPSNRYSVSGLKKSEQ